MLSMNVLSDPVGKAILSHFTEGKTEARRESLPVSLPRSCLKEKSGSRTPLEQDATLTGAGRDPRALPTRQRGTETQSGKAAALMRILVSPHPRVIQPPTPCRSPHLQQNPKHLKIEHVVLSGYPSPQKSRHGRHIYVRYPWQRRYAG